MNIHVYIERLILDGLPVALGEGHLVREAVEAELTHLLAERGPAPWMRSGGAVPRLEATVVAGVWSGPADLGASIARAAYGGRG